MSEFRTIEIDLDVHKRIELERKSFAESPNDALRRLLGLNGSNQIAHQPGMTEPKGRAWSGDAVKLPHGTKVRMEYRGREHSGEVEDGEWVVEGRRFGTPSGAAAGVAKTKAGTPASLNGWDYWNVKRPGDEDWIRLKSLRPEFVALTDDEL
jgi:hypothetical protein